LRGTLFFRKRYLVYVPEHEKLYLFLSEHDSTPREVIPLEGAKLGPSKTYPKEEAQGYFMVHIKRDGNAPPLVFASQTPQQRDLWTTSLAQSIPVEGQEDEAPLPGQERRLWDFQAEDIDGNIVDMKIYEGTVAVVVNVASQ